MFTAAPLSLAIGTMAFAAIAKLAASFDIGKATSATLAVVIPFVPVVLLRYVYLASSSLPLVGNLLTWGDAILLSAQFIIAVYVFDKLQRNTETYVSWFGWLIAGILLVVITTPLVLNRLLGI